MCTKKAKKYLTYNLCSLIDEQDSIHSHSQNEAVGVCPEALVTDVEEGAPIQRVVFDSCEVPHLGLDLRLTHPIGLQIDRDDGSEDIYNCSNTMQTETH